jgi:YesN/AraC family two-component response regulator
MPGKKSKPKADLPFSKYEILVDNALPPNRQVHIYEKKHIGSQPYTYHYHTTNQLLYVINGEGRFFFQKNSYTIKKKDLIIINKNERHLLLYGVKSEPTVCVINFSDAVFQYLNSGISLLEFLQKLHDKKKIISTDEYYLRDIPLLLKEMLFERKNEFIDFQQFLAIKLLEILLLLKRSSLSADSPDKEKQYLTSTEKNVLNTLHYIDMNYYRRLTLDEMAHMAWVSKRQYMRIFKKISGKTFVEYLNGVRINHAKQLLWNKDLMKITTVCFETGFEDISYFYRIFKVFTGTTPKLFMQSIRTDR